MTQTLAQRIASFKGNPRVRDTDLEALIADAKDEQERLVASATAHDAESIDFALSDDDREEASRLAGSFQRAAAGLANEITALEQQLEDKRNSDKRKAEEAEEAARKARYDALVAKFRDRVPALVNELVGIFQELQANGGGDAIEADARGVPRTFHNVGPIAQFLKMKIPAWNGCGHQWPPAAPNPMALASEYHARAVARMHEDQRREAARWARYHVSAPKNGNRTFVETRRGMVGIGEGFQRDIEAVMTVEAVEDAKANGCEVVALRPNESIGMSIGSGIIG